MSNNNAQIISVKEDLPKEVMDFIMKYLEEAKKDGSGNIDLTHLHRLIHPTYNLYITLRVLKEIVNELNKKLNLNLTFHDGSGYWVLF